MTDTFRTKTFKSGNSVALRLPKSFGLPEGTEVNVVRESHASYRFEPVDAPKRKIDVSKFAGKAPWLKPIERYDFEDAPRDWDAFDKPDREA